MSRIFRALHLLKSFLLLAFYRALYPGLRFGRMVEIGRGVRLEMSHGGKLLLGDRVRIDPGCLLHAKGDLEIGSCTVIGQGTVIVAHERISIGRDGLIAERVTIRDQNHRTSAFPYRAQGMIASPVNIGEDVWLGAGAVVLKGVSIGDHAIVGANAVVTKDVPERTTVVGIPASKR